MTLSRVFQAAASIVNKNRRWTESPPVDFSWALREDFFRIAGVVCGATIVGDGSRLFYQERCWGTLFRSLHEA